MTYQDDIIDTATLQPEFFYRKGEKPIWAETSTRSTISNTTRTGVNNIGIVLLTILDPRRCTYIRNDALEEDIIVLKLAFDDHPDVTLIFRVSDDKAKLTEH